jgi:hypothetical protein
MATSIPPALKTFTCSTDLSAKQYHFVKLSAAQTVAICSGTTDIPIGILQNKPDGTTHKEAVVALLGGGGTSKLVAGGALGTPGTIVATKADGRAQAAVATQYPGATTIDTAGADGDIIEVSLGAPTVKA